MEPKVVQWEDKTFVGFKETYTFSNVGERIGEHFARFYDHFKEIPHAVNHAACWCVATDRAEDFDYLISLEVSAPAEVSEGMVCERVPARTYAVFTHRGIVTDVANTYDYIYKTWLPQSPYQRDPEAVFFELYDERFTSPDAPDAEMDIYIPIVKKQ